MHNSEPKNPIAFEKGRTEALREIDSGFPRLFWGTRGTWGQFMEELFHSRFGVKVEHTDSFIWDELKSYRSGYNSVVIDFIDRKFGVGAFDKARAEVQQFRMNYYEDSKPQNDHNL